MEPKEAIEILWDSAAGQMAKAAENRDADEMRRCQSALTALEVLRAHFS